MTILRHYIMKAAEGRGDALRQALVDLAGKVAPLDGCLKVEMSADSSDPTVFAFVEHWASVADHKAAGAKLGKEAFAPVMAVLAGPPDGRYLEEVPLA